MSQVNQGNGESAVGNQDDYMNEKQFNLIDGFLIIFRRKKLIVTIAVSFLLVVFLYGVFAERVYQTDIVVMRPSIDNVKKLNVKNKDVAIVFEEIKFEGVSTTILDDGKLGETYNNFIDEIISRSMVKKFFDEKNMFFEIAGKTTEAASAGRVNQVFDSFYRQLSVNKNNSMTVISLTGTDSENIGLWLNELVDFVNKEMVDLLVQDLRISMALFVQNINNTIEHDRVTGEWYREDQIATKQEQYAMAKKLGIDRTVVTQFTDEYLKGTRLLQAEIEMLKNQNATVLTSAKTEDTMRMNTLKGIQQKLEPTILDNINVTAVVVKKKAGEHVELVKPKLRWMLAGVLALVLGIVLAFIVELVNSIKKREKSTA